MREVEILLIEEDQGDAETAISILQKNKLGNKLIHLKDGREAKDFIFCTGLFAERDINNQPKAIVFNMKMMKAGDMEFLNEITANERTKNISLVVFTKKYEESKSQINENKLKGAMLLGLFDLTHI